MVASQINTSEDSDGEVYFGNRIVDHIHKAALVRGVFEGVSGQYDLMNDLMSFGIHRLWKDAMVDALNPAPPLVLADVAGGTGDIGYRVCERMSRRRRESGEKSTITICDLTPAMVSRGRDRALDQGIVSDINFVVGDAEQLPLADTSQDAVTNAFGIRNVSDPQRALRETRRVLRRGGRFLCLEFGGPVSAGLRPMFNAYTSGVLPRLGQIVTGQGDAYQYLADSIRRFPTRNTFATWMEGAGLSRVRATPLSGGIATLYSAWRL